jgi:hypothetical protein
MLNNEISLCDAFLGHAVLLFDRHLLACHNSIDGTFEKLSSRLPNSVVKMNSEGYPQSTVMTQLMIGAFEAGADVVIPLDADEFLPFSTREELNGFLQSHEDVDVLQVRWRNFTASKFPLDSKLSNLVFAHDYSAIHKSFVYRSAYLKDRTIELTQGNHDIKDSAKLKIKNESTSYIIHVPIRDPLHFAQKNIHGASSYLNESKHTLSDDWIAGALNPFPSEQDLIRLALDYGGLPCSNEHKNLRNIESKPWMLNGFDQSKQKESFLMVMREDWPNIKKMYQQAGDGETSEIEVRILKQRIKNIETSLVIRLILKFNKRAKQLYAKVRRIRS